MARLGLAAAAALALSAAGEASAAPALHHGAEERRPWYLPDHAKLQLAGNVGFLSPALGYAFLGRRLESDVFFGWVPEAIGGADIFSVTGKVTGAPVIVSNRARELRPVTLAVQLTYTFGDEYFIDPPSRFPGKYYDFPTALRAGIGVGSAADVRVGGRRVGAYFELVALDVMLKAWADNRRTLGLRDVFSLALGLRVET